jgi:phosphatidate phosphatase PAH1
MKNVNNGRTASRALIVTVLACLAIVLAGISYHYTGTGMLYGATEAEDCYAGSPLDSVPALKLPAKERWRNLTTALFIVTQGPPYHMVHDLVVAPGQPQVVVGKFDYGSIFHKDLEYEKVYVYIYGTGMSAWQKVATCITDWDGKVYAQIPARGPGEYMIKMVVPGDLSVAYGYMMVLDTGRNTVVFDVDGTLTTTDFEAVEDYLNVDDGDAIYYSSELVNLYKRRGYQVVYLTARPYWTARMTRSWFNLKGFPNTILHTTLNNIDTIDANETEEYKIDFLLHLRNDVGMNLISAYGNSSTDIGAYKAAGIPDDSIFIIGDSAGDEGTVPITGNYYNHYWELEEVLECGY